MEEKAIELVSKLCEYNCTDKNINKMKKNSYYFHKKRILLKQRIII